MNRVANLLSRFAGVLKRWRSRKSVDQPRVLVLGEQLAAARRAEAAHRPVLPSPLGEAEYENQPPTFLQPIVEEGADRRVKGVVERFRRATEADRAGLTASLTMDDFYTVRQFAIRSAERTLEDGQSRHVDDGLGALAMIDKNRIDPRDVSWAASLLRVALTEATSIDVADELFRCAADLAGSGTAEILRSFVGMSPETARAGSLLKVFEFEGRKVFVETGIGPFNSGRDLLGASARMADLLAADGLVVGAPVVGDSVGFRWLDGSPGSQNILERAIASVSVRVVGRPDAPPLEQLFLSFVFELASAGDVEAFERAWQAGERDFASLVVTRQQFLALIIARSSTVGTASAESDASLRRFSAPFTELLQWADES